jgi:dihydrolipoamide dehydrogenase
MKFRLWGNVGRLPPEADPPVAEKPSATKRRTNMKNATKNLAVIGGGPAGYVGAIRGAQLGANVFLIEKEEVGGTCLNVGCIPTKVLTSAAHTFSMFKRADQFGLKISDVSLDLPQLMRKKQATVRKLVTGVKYLLRSNQVNIIAGTAKFLDRNTIEIEKKDKTKEKIKADCTLIATGSVPIKLPIPGIDSPGVIGSTEALTLEEIPEEFLIIGAGAIGCEFASIYHTFGSNVTIVEMLPQILPMEDEEIALSQKRLWEKAGVKIYAGSRVTQITSRPDGKKIVTISTSEKEIEVKADKILVSVGRKANLNGLAVENIELGLEKGNIVVDEFMKTNIPNMYAAGDCIGGYLLAHVASMEAEVAVENALGENIKMDYLSVPRCTFTYPEIASAGLTEKEAKDKGIRTKVGRFPFMANGRALAENESEGLVKIIADESGKIVGAHILGNRATDLIAELTLAIKMQAKAEDIIETTHAHPTLPEAIREAVLKLEGRPIHIL